MSSLCPNKEVCGSCGWSHIPYDEQLKQKLADINGSLALKEVPLKCDTILPSPQTEHYRNRMDFVIDFEGRVGLRQKGKWWRVIDDHTCFLSMHRIEELYKATRAWSQTAGLSFFDRKAHTGLLRYAVIRFTTQGQSMITIVTSGTEHATESEEQIRTALEQLATKSGVSTLIWSINNTITDVSFGDDLHVVHGPGHIEERINDLVYRITPNAFFQTNPYGAELLQTTVLNAVGDVSNKTVLDLYCGSGFFAIALARQAKRVVGVELVPEAIADARVNAELNNVSVEFHDAKTEEYSWGDVNADVVILDPPRSGMHNDALADVLSVAPDRIVYVSCSYKNFAREMVQLQAVYDVESMTAIDMFPHTPHVELVTVLTKKGV